MSEAQSLELREPSPKSRRVPEKFKRDAVRLVTEELYIIKAAGDDLGPGRLIRVYG